MTQVKRVYDEPSPEDGYRVLVDRLWPRGMSKEAARIDTWLPELAPSHALRRQFAHDPARCRWEDFRRRYREELEALERALRLRELADRAQRETVTLLFAARDREHNNAVALKEAIESVMSQGSNQ